MRTLGVLVVFIISLLGLGSALEARANSYVVIRDGVSEPVEMPGSELAKGHEEKKKADGGDDEESEEELFPSQSEALQALDPGVLDDMLRFRIASRSR